MVSGKGDLRFRRDTREGAAHRMQRRKSHLRLQRRSGGRLDLRRLRQHLRGRVEYVASSDDTAHIQGAAYLSGDRVQQRGCGRTLRVPVRKRDLRLVILCSCIFPAFAADSKPTVEILNYEQQINPRSNHSLDVEYTLKLKVISADKDITWIKIPIQNSSVDDFESISDNIDEICYYEEDGKDYIRVNLNKIYSENDIIEIKFSVCQSDIHTINNDIIYYSYVVYGFSDIDVKELSIFWNSKNVLESSSYNIDSNSYYTWNTKLQYDQKFNIFIQYDSKQFKDIFVEQDNDEISNNDETSETENQDESDDNDWDWGSFMVGIFVGILIVLFVSFILEEFF